MLDLKASENNELEFTLRSTGDKITLLYRTPTTKERIDYLRECFIRKGVQVIDNTFATRIKYGKKLITGISENSLAWDGKPISSDVKNPDYKENWKDLVEEGAAHLLAYISLTAFEDELYTSGGSRKETEGENNHLPLD